MLSIAIAICIICFIVFVIYRSRQITNSVKRGHSHIKTDIEKCLRDLSYNLQLYPEKSQSTIQSQIDTLSFPVQAHVINYYNNEYFTYSTYDKSRIVPSGFKIHRSNTRILEELFHHWYSTHGHYTPNTITTHNPVYTSYYGDRNMSLFFTMPVYSQRQDGQVLFIVCIELTTKLRKHTHDLVTIQ